MAYLMLMGRLFQNLGPMTEKSLFSSELIYHVNCSMVKTKTKQKTFPGVIIGSTSTAYCSQSNSRWPLQLLSLNKHKLIKFINIVLTFCVVVADSHSQYIL